MMKSTAARKSQSGMAMVIGLILLVVMTLLAVTAMRSTMMQERMAGGMRDHGRALEAAEAALREGERMLNQAAAPTFPGDGLYDAGDDDIPVWEDVDAGLDSSGALEYSPDMDDLARDPQFFIERISGIMPAPGSSLEAGASDGTLYRIRARGFGAREETVVVLEGFFQR